ncbi:MAG: hypothetical protein R3D67_05395 [Hyphomicrobiaceae bacterium]
MSMKMPSSKAIVFNAAALLVGLSAVIVAIRSTLFEPDIPPCTERFSHGVRMQLAHDDGTPLSVEDLQGRLSNTDWGLMQNASVVALRTGPAKQALQIRFANQPPRTDERSSNDRPGVGFLWSPHDMGRAKSACLAYSVFVPKGFEFGVGTRLPGLMGAEFDDAATSGRDRQPTFSTRYAWSENGSGDIYAHMPEWQTGRPLGGKENGFNLTRGRWVSLEQEVVLNTPGKRDGALRVWIDGKLQLRKADVAFRQKPTTVIAGVMAEAVPGQNRAAAKAGDDQIWMTPFEIRWQ